MTSLGEVAAINPREEAPAQNDLISFVGMAELNAETATALAREARPFAAVSKGYTVFRDRDILAAKITPCWENGKVGQAKLEHARGVGSTEFHVLRPGPSLSGRYLLHFLRQPHIRAAGERRMTGSAGQKRVPAAYLKDLTIPMPSLPEQRRIAAILDQADALRTKRRQALVHLDALTPALFRSMFGDPVQNDRALPLERLSELGRLDRGVSKHRPRNDPSLMGGSHPLIQTGDVANSGGYITTFDSSYSDAGLAQSRMWPAGTLCITIAANIAKTGILSFDACFPDSVVGFTADPETTTYVRVWLGFLQATLEASAPQSAQRNINLAILRALEIPMPERSGLTQFHECVERLESARHAVRASIATDDELFASLQSRAFRGEF